MIETELEITFRGDTKEDAVEALSKLENFLTKKKYSNLYRFCYVNITDADGAEHNVSRGVTGEGIYKYLERAKTMIDKMSPKDISRVYISGSVTKKYDK